MLDEYPSGVVLDDALADTLLSLAFQEGLLRSEPPPGTIDVRSGILRDHKPNRHLVQNALEQVVVGGKIYLPRGLPDYWVGPLRDDDLLVRAEPKTAKALDVGAEVTLAMLQMRGVVWTREHLEKVVADYLDAWTAFVAEEGDVPWPIYVLTHRPPYSSAALRLNLARIAASPVERCVANYADVVATAVAQNAMSALPIVMSSGDAVPFSRRAHDDVMVVLNVVCEEMRTLPRASTLARTVKLAQSAEADALRTKLHTWAAGVRKGEIDEDFIRREIAYVSKQLADAKSQQVAGTFCTAVSVAATLVELAHHNAGTAVASLAATLIGGIFAITENDVLRRNRWAMFSSVRTE